MIVICPTSFKGTLSAAAAARAMAEGAGAVTREPIRIAPVSDGGPGLLDALQNTEKGSMASVPVSGPLGEPTSARMFTFSGGVAVECADACGLHLLSEDRRDAVRATSYGVGELLRAAAMHASRIVLGLGGTATVDAGAGMAEALGWRLLDRSGVTITRGGGGLERLHCIEPAPTRFATQVIPLADVRTRLIGRDGAAATFAPQKGASAAGVALLERALENFARVVQRDLGVEVRAIEGGGAAGGLGAACRVFLGAAPVSGSEWVLERLGFRTLLGAASAVVTGEGAFDAQSAMGKVTGCVMTHARRAGVPVLLVTGSVRGSVPPGVLAVHGGGRTLSAADLAAFVAQELPQLLSAATAG